ncbi:hypothetical protein L2E82_08163 [Cichorium intybus]|uniref:Uncharacterized protein n=1 Tax=Cichorium intybus TaxID=13427 RepID=A0ACB9G569_CICIN|nr:hypothetical protein L2E82_08163 [Cichorium intybus]
MFLPYSTIKVSITANSASKEKTQVHIRELEEEEVKLLKNLSHANIGRYLGTVREEETLRVRWRTSGLGSCLKLYNLVAGPFGSFLISWTV